MKISHALLMIALVVGASAAPLPSPINHCFLFGQGCDEKRDAAPLPEPIAEPIAEPALEARGSTHCILIGQGCDERRDPEPDPETQSQPER
jgi:hypothetical protein